MDEKKSVEERKEVRDGKLKSVPQRETDSGRERKRKTEKLR